MEIRVKNVRLVSGESPSKAEVWEMAAAIPGSEVIETKVITWIEGESPEEDA